MGPAQIPRPQAGLVIPLAVHIDNLAVIMFLMVTFIATLIHIYSMGYMHDDPRLPAVLHVPVALLLLDARAWSRRPTSS